MKLFRTSIIDMTAGIICVYTGLIALIVSLLLIFGVFVDAGGIYNFFADAGFSCITLSVLSPWFLTLAFIIGGALTAFGFWAAGLVALYRTDVKRYLIPEALVFMLCDGLMEQPDVFHARAVVECSFYRMTDSVQT